MGIAVNPILLSWLLMIRSLFFFRDFSSQQLLMDLSLTAWWQLPSSKWKNCGIYGSTYQLRSARKVQDELSNHSWPRTLCWHAPAYQFWKKYITEEPAASAMQSFSSVENWWIQSLAKRLSMQVQFTNMTWASHWLTYIPLWRKCGPDFKSTSKPWSLHMVILGMAIFT